MEKETKTIRLIYPQWQGANIVKLITEVENPDDASRGYVLGAQLLNFLAPDNGQETLTVPVSTEITDRKGDRRSPRPGYYSPSNKSCIKHATSQ